jgi:hypothetical protein
MMNDDAIQYYHYPIWLEPPCGSRRWQNGDQVSHVTNDNPRAGFDPITGQANCLAHSLALRAWISTSESAASRPFPPSTPNSQTGLVANTPPDKMPTRLSKTRKQ